MKERRKNLHSIISKISGNVEPNSEADTQGPVITAVTGSLDSKSDEKPVSEMKIADEQPQRPVTRMYAKEGEELLRHEAAIRRINSQLLDPVASPPFICDLCSVAFLTKRELHLHVMCHGIHIAGNVGGEKVKPAVQVSVDEPQTSEGASEMTDGQSDPEPVVVNSEVKIVDVLSLATATRGFKEPGSIWCSLCKCTVDKGHTCKVYQTSYHADKTEEGFTCELCGRFYNQKRKLRTHLRNRHKGFRLQEDEGYMCWQCWQAFPEIKILEEHIVQVHGHESRRQNSTWRPFTQPSTLPLDENADDSVSPDPNGSPVEDVANADQLNSALKRVSEDAPIDIPAKKPNMDPVNGVISVAEVNGKVVVTDTPISGDVSPTYPPTTSGAAGVPGPRDVPVAAVVAANPNGVNGNDSISQTSGNFVSNAAVPSADNSKRKSPSNTKHNCPHCTEKFAKRFMLQLHIQEAHGENMHCFFCSTSCATKEVLASHIKVAHTEEMKNGKCPICQCKCLGELHQHIVQYHHKDLLTRKSKERVLSTCPVCNIATTDSYHLRWHILREHRGLQVPKELQDGWNEDTGSESGSSASNEGSDKLAEGIKGQNTTSEDNGGQNGATRGNSDQGKSKENDLEIVFVSDKNISSNWSNPPPKSVFATSAAAPDWSNQSTKSVLQSNAANDSSGQCIKKPADSSVGVNPKVNQTVNTQGEVHSTTGQLEQTNERASPIKYDYYSLSEDTCVFCFKTLTKETLSSHLRSDHGWVDTFTCPVCPAKAETYLSIVEHFCQSHFHPTDEVAMTQCDAKCLKCDIIFQDVSHLKKHASALHSFQLPSEASYNTFKCRHCNIIFEKQFDAQKHFDVYHLFRIRFKCESCRMGFTAKHDFQEHVTCNHPELVKSFCPVCGLGFEVSSDLEEHVFEMHRRKAQFFCAQCGNEFGDRFHVHMHIRSNCCVTWADSNFECLDCLTAFSTISELRIHCKQRSCKQEGRN